MNGFHEHKRICYKSDMGNVCNDFRVPYLTQKIQSSYDHSISANPSLTGRFSQKQAEHIIKSKLYKNTECKVPIIMEIHDKVMVGWYGGKNFIFVNIFTLQLLNRFRSLKWKGMPLINTLFTCYSKNHG